MESTALMPVAQYVRMSTEDQQYSIANQESVIADYARRRGFEVIATYSDPGRSGVSIRSRNGLRQLLSDAIGGVRPTSKSCSAKNKNQGKAVVAVSFCCSPEAARSARQKCRHLRREVARVSAFHSGSRRSICCVLEVVAKIRFQ
jgi:hypothetical protein